MFTVENPSSEILTVVECSFCAVLLPFVPKVTTGAVLSNLNIPDCDLVSLPKLSLAFTYNIYSPEPEFFVISSPLFVVPVYSWSVGSPAVANFHTYVISAASADVIVVACVFAQLLASFGLICMLGP